MIQRKLRKKAVEQSFPVRDGVGAVSGVFAQPAVAEENGYDRTDGDKDRQEEDEKPLLVVHFGQKDVLTGGQGQYAKEENNDVLHLHK